MIIDGSLYNSSHLDNIHQTNMTAAMASTENTYLSYRRHYHYPISYNPSAIKHNKSIRKTLLDIWQRLIRDELHLCVSSSREPKHIENGVKKNNPRWKGFLSILRILLTFTRPEKAQHQWIQLVGHHGTFKKGNHAGYILKEMCAFERKSFELLQNDILKDFIPKYDGAVEDNEGKLFIEIEDLLASFHEPCIMDCKIGVRTYLEEDLDKAEYNPEPRSDLYNKMIAIDPLSPTDKENQEKKILKPRYMVWRESLSSSQTLGFRIEAMKKSHGLMSKRFQTVKEYDDVKKQLFIFVDNSIPRALQYLERLLDLRLACIRSNFFQTHEIVGSSLLFVHDETKASLWMIDFGKTRLLPDDIQIAHNKPWIRGSHEDGYLIGLNNLILILQEIIHEL